MKKCTMGVDEKGMIVFMKDVEGKSGGVQELRERLGWGDAEADVVTMSYEDEEEGVGFWFPGFVGMSLPFLASGRTCGVILETYASRSLFNLTS